MPRKPKLPKFKIFATLENCIDVAGGQSFDYDWSDDSPIVMELGCGRAELLLELARRYPARRYLGVDIKSDRLYKPAQIAQAEGLKQITFVRANARHLGEIVPDARISELWLTFPDPYPKKRAAKHRLTHPLFLQQYARMLKPGGLFNFKTDNKALFEWSLERIASTKSWRLERLSFDLHADADDQDDARILTTYERKFIQSGLPINYVSLKLSRSH